MQYVIFDIDGTLFDDAHRRHLIHREGDRAQNIEAYHTRMHLDPVVPWVADEFRRWLNHVDEIDTCRIRVLTGRPHKWRQDTLKQLRSQFGDDINDDMLLMRPDEGHLAALSSPEFKITLLEAIDIDSGDIAAVYEDRRDVIEAYANWGVPLARIREVNFNKFDRVPCAEEVVKTPIYPTDAADVLSEAAKTFRERNAVYADNYKLVAPVIRALFPNGVPGELVTTEHWHLFELIVVKLTRFAQSQLTHQDSMRDTAVYAAMIESILSNQENEND